ncbi:MAG: precorrin-8X methylmutase [Oscillospiraceae bacterium]|nr:precorrin-8X methylmutase [Oscillospiraceae bacterium]
MRPEDIEKKSFEIIESELTSPLDPKLAPIIKRVIHTTADFDYETSMAFSEAAVDSAREAIRNGAVIVTDTNMARAGISAKSLARFGGQVLCYIADSDVAETAKANGTTRARAAVDKARELNGPLIFAVGNAPTALIRICELIESGALAPALVIGAPVGFVNVVESKEMLMRLNVPYIVTRGRKGGSNVAAAICNALIYGIEQGDV